LGGEEVLVVVVVVFGDWTGGIMKREDTDMDSDGGGEGGIPVWEW